MKNHLGNGGVQSGYENFTIKGSEKCAQGPEVIRCRGELSKK